MEEKEDKREHKYLSDYGIKDYYKLYYDTCYSPQVYKYTPVPKDIRVSQKVYTQIVQEFLSYVLEYIVHHPEGYKFPHKLGTAQIVKIKMDFESLKKKNKLRIDFGHFRKTGQKIYFTNESTDNHYCKWVWNRRGCNIPFASNYKFRFNREKKRETGRLFKEQKVDYYLRTIQSPEELKQKNLDRKQKKLQYLQKQLTPNT